MRDRTILDLFRLDGRVAIVTGASSGLVVDFARALAEAGADVVLAARRVDKLYATARLVEDAGRRALTVAMDIADPASVLAAASKPSSLTVPTSVFAFSPPPLESRISKVCRGDYFVLMGVYSLRLKLLLKLSDEPIEDRVGCGVDPESTNLQ